MTLFFAAVVVWLVFDRFALRKKLVELQRVVAQLSVHHAGDALKGDMPDASTETAHSAADVEDDASIGERKMPWGDTPVGDPDSVSASGFADDEIADVVAGQGAAQSKSSSRFVFTAEMLVRFVTWAKVNWFYMIAATSLALSGVFLIQYGVESGLLSPLVRIIAALVLGALLLGYAESLRRRGGDADGDLFAYLPSTLAAGGVVTLFAAIWGAYGLYGFLSPIVALVLLGVVGLLTIGLGWFYGPLLAAIGIAGAMASPFLIGGESDVAFVLYYYFALVTVSGLAIDALKKWAWLSAMALIVGFLAATLLYLTEPSQLHFMLFALICTIAASTIPIRSSVPHHGGAGVLETLFIRRGSERGDQIEFPTRLSWGTLAASSGLTLYAAQAGFDGFWLGMAGFGVLLIVTIFWMRGAVALSDAVILPAAGLLILGAISGPNMFLIGGARSFNPSAIWADDTTLQIYAFVGLTALASLFGAWRSLLTTEKYRASWAIFAASMAPFGALVAEFFWSPSTYLGTPNWGICLIGIAVIMAMLVQRYGSVDGDDKSRLSYALVSAMTMAAFSSMVVLDAAALTLTLAVMVFVSLALDRKFNLPLLAGLAAVGVVFVSARLLVYPGILWAIDADLWQMLFAYAGAILLLVAGVYQLRKEARDRVRGVLESAIWSLAAVFVSIVIFRWIDSLAGRQIHWALGLFSFVWLVSAANQFHRVQLGGSLAPLRRLLTITYGTLGCLLVLAALTISNPLGAREFVVGPPVVNSLLIAYGFPALVFGFSAYWFSNLGKKMLAALIVSAAFLSCVYVGLAIRHIWRGPNIRIPGMVDGELYSYTVVMMIVSSALLVLALLRRSGILRRIALLALGISAAKVFLIDAAGLAGLFRVVSFLALGLALAGLAWLDKRFGGDRTSISDEETQGS